ncbi:MerR family transcriptional regulator [Cellulomonas chengniuliangii]|uniref:MerR family transcriptional regulator n=1 Tax=Cellulomonas chengniuliangii TaxID=2968084 RepID=A0ABY5KXY5_9CELL|nr:MerR family transcriptional regulator [Cellulomonas chengniuliangii]MCC2309741.1 MerR family transcriptional regulator [Cellulomonas chengniuliangii]MCC2319037.1 MerR family transcriptional regulator [Cellulomonas chengniuliangii]UUI74713.1 MerR family transcriptional regulator [Cellulomonas chengniuliangii]
MATFTPAETARRSGFSIDTLRYYERIGLLSGVRRDHAGRRAYSEADLGWLEILRCLRDTGMPIATMRQYAALALASGADAEQTIPERIEILEHHASEVAATIDLLRRQQQHLTEKIAHYRGLVAAVDSAPEPSPAQMS